MKRRRDGKAALTVSATTAAVLAGEDDLSGWSDDELLRGQRRDKNGNWPGVRPQVVPQRLHDERNRRLMKDAMQKMREALPDAVAVLHQIATDPNASRTDKVKAAGLILSHALPKNIQLDVSATLDATPAFVKVVEAAMVYRPADEPEARASLPRRSYADVIDAEIVEDDPEIEWD